MLTLLSAAAIIAASIGAALGLLLILRLRWTPAKMREVNDATAFYITVAGTIYAVILAFMLTSVWEEFQHAKMNAEQEANSLVNVFRIAGAFPDPWRGELRSAARAYAGAMIGEEWPAMASSGGDTGRRGAECVENLWQVMTRIEAGRLSEQAALQQALGELARMTEQRRVRHLQSQYRLPFVLWLVLIFGGVVTVANSCLLGVENARLHALYIVSLTCLMTLVLVAIAEINRPFQGIVVVGPDAFRMALATFDQFAAN